MHLDPEALIWGGLILWLSIDVWRLEICVERLEQRIHDMEAPVDEEVTSVRF